MHKLLIEMLSTNCRIIIKHSTTGNALGLSIFSPGGVKLTTLTLDGNRIWTPLTFALLSIVEL